MAAQATSTTEQTSPRLPDRLLTTAEVAELLGMTPGAVLASRNRGTPPGTLGMRIGKGLRFDPADLADFLDTAKQAARERLDRDGTYTGNLEDVE